MKGLRVRVVAEVLEAQSVGRPLVVLESTVITHGLPYPQNLQTARAAENAVRSRGAIPATIAILGGSIHFGLDDAELTELAQANASLPEPAAGCGDAVDRDRKLVGQNRDRFIKASRRDLAAAMAQGTSAGTTVAATLQLARRFALEPLVMATGGLGGVHQGAAVSFDVSADLDELARADGALVVCSGFKSILDVPASLEALELRGVLIVGYQTDLLPGFLTRSSGLPLEHRVDSPAEAAALVRAHRALALPGAVVLVQPVPDPDAMSALQMEQALDAALRQARQRGVTGKALTPFLLDSIRQGTDGASLAANCALLVANAQLAGEMAVALYELEARPQ